MCKQRNVLAPLEYVFQRTNTNALESSLRFISNSLVLRFLVRIVVEVPFFFNFSHEKIVFGEDDDDGDLNSRQLPKSRLCERERLPGRSSVLRVWYAWRKSSSPVSITRPLAIGTSIHNLQPCDIKMNSKRGS